MRVERFRSSISSKSVNDLFEAQEVTIPELLRRIEALEAMIFKNAPPEPAKRLQVPTELKLAWARWDAYRKPQKGWNEDAKRVNLSKLVSLAGSDDLLAQLIVGQSIEFGYRGLFPLKGDAKPAPSAVQGKTKAEALTPCETKQSRDRAYILRQYELDQITATERDSRLAALEGT